MGWEGWGVMGGEGWGGAVDDALGPAKNFL